MSDLTAVPPDAKWLARVRAEYLEIPGLSLTKPQVQRFWGLDPETCDAVLTALEHAKFLRRTRDHMYVRAEAR
jgi:hypothetical protein